MSLRCRTATSAAAPAGEGPAPMPAGSCRHCCAVEQRFCVLANVEGIDAIRRVFNGGVEPAPWRRTARVPAADGGGPGPAAWRRPGGRGLRFVFVYLIPLQRRAVVREAPEALAARDRRDVKPRCKCSQYNFPQRQ